MLPRIFGFFHKRTSIFSRTELVMKLLRLKKTNSDPQSRGLVMVQIDGLSHTQLERALREGHMPFLKRLIKREHYKNHLMYSGIPSCTPAFQGELFYGVKSCVPAFSFLHHKNRKFLKMYDCASANEIEKNLEKLGAGLLEGGSSYANIFRGGAAESHFCAADIGWKSLLKAVNPLVFPFFLVLYVDVFCRTFVLALIELWLSLLDGVRGFLRGKQLLQEAGYIPVRVGACVLLREFVVACAKVDLARGLPIIHLNMLGYDEQAHRRGPGSWFAHWSLRGIDSAIEWLWRAARHSGKRHYDVWVYSDHGQELVAHFPHETHISLEKVIEKLMGPNVKHTAMGPLANVYPPTVLTPQEVEAAALGFIRDYEIPLVFSSAGDHRAWAWTANGKYKLPEEAEAIFGAHPFLEELGADAARLCHNNDAGQLILSGWSKDRRMTFYPEGGSHAGPGAEETSAFALLPSDAPLEKNGKTHLRPTQLREAVRHFLSGHPSAAESVPLKTAPRSLRVMTYNVHSCLGMDGRISPERVARVIARQNPDVVALQELDMSLKRTGGVHQAQQIARLLNMQFLFHPSFYAKDGQFGNAVFSRFPMKVVKVGALPKKPGQIYAEPRGALWVSLELPEKKLQLITTHLSLWPQEGLLQAKALRTQWVEEALAQGDTVLCGDFNAAPGTGIYQEIISRLYDAQICLPFHKPVNTWFGRYPFMRIDHIFISEGLEVSACKVCNSSLDRTTSDHLPLVVDIQLPALVSPEKETSVGSVSGRS